MKFIAILLLTATFAQASDTMKLGTVEFNHKQHQIRNDNKCDNCHELKIGKVEDFDKEWAHRVCAGCHEVFDQGPTDCKGCHK
jgi:hypothetical protein